MLHGPGFAVIKRTGSGIPVGCTWTHSRHFSNPSLLLWGRCPQARRGFPQVRASNRGEEGLPGPAAPSAKQAEQQAEASKPPALVEEPGTIPQSGEQLFSSSEQAQAQASSIADQPPSASNGGNSTGTGGEIEDEAPAGPDGQAVTAPQPAPQQQQQQQEQQPAIGVPWKELAAAFAALAALCRSMGHGFLALLNKLPLWMQQQRLKRLREACEEDPKSPEKHASLLSELNRISPREVIVRVESKQYASGAAVVAEYLRALVLTGKLTDYASGASPEKGQDHRSMSQLLREMQAQVAAEEQDDMPGSSLRRPLHVTVQGGQLMQMNKPTGPLQAVWALLTTIMLIVGMAFLWLVGSQAMRRMQATSPSNAAAVGGVASSGANSPSMDPKEYKKEELPEKSIKSFKDVRGCDEAKEELQEVVEFLKNPSKFTRLGAKLPKGVLLTGPPGTGKTLLARAVAGEAGVPFFYRAGSEFEELYVGVGSRRMRALFQAAKKKAPCIVFIDEIDAIGGNRKHWENHARKTLNQLLVEMDGFESNEGVIVMAATNLVETLDPALKRPGRFDRQVAVPLPDIKGRTELIDYYLHDKPFAADVDRDVLARQTQGFSGADISNLVNEAALTAAKEGADTIAPHMLDQAFDKIRMGVERKSVRRTEQARKRTAYHEAGHAIVALHTPGASPIHKATIVPRGHALGMVSQVGREDEFSINRQQMLARIWVCMGGQVAEELMFGKDQVTTGATDDLRQATDMARYMVSECGMNDVVGPMYVSEGDSRHNVLSETVKERIDAQVRKVLVEARAGVMELLQSRVAELHSLAGALIEVETLTSKQINDLLGLDAAEAPSTPSSGTGGSSGGSGGSGSDKEDPLDPAGVLAPGVPAPTAQVPTPHAPPSSSATDAPHHHSQAAAAAPPTLGRLQADGPAVPDPSPAPAAAVVLDAATARAPKSLLHLQPSTSHLHHLRHGTSPPEEAGMPALQEPWSGAQAEAESRQPSPRSIMPQQQQAQEQGCSGMQGEGSGGGSGLHRLPMQGESAAEEGGRMGTRLGGGVQASPAAEQLRSIRGKGRRPDLAMLPLQQQQQRQEGSEVGP